MFDILYPIRRAHGYLHDKHLVNKGIKNKNDNDSEPDFPIDFVMLWVDGNDPKWQEKKERYTPRTKAELSEVKPEDSGKERYRDWDILQYWFRAVEKYAPWVNRVFIVTDSQIPPFLNLSNSKIKIVDHSEIIDKKYLPLFNSCAIEINIHKIEGLSEHFVYFNDDVFLAKPVLKKDFFSAEGLPKHCAAALPYRPHLDTSPYLFHLINCLAVINSKFLFSNVLYQRQDRWFSTLYSRDEREENLQLLYRGYLLGMYNPHLGIPLRISTCEQVWEECFEVMSNTCKHRFRSAFDISHPLYTLYEMANNTFEPVDSSHYGMYYSITMENVDQITDDFYTMKYKMICINDSRLCTQNDFPILQRKISDCLGKVFPERSSFEIR